MKICVLQPTYRYISVQTYMSMVNLLNHFLTKGDLIQYAISDQVKIDHVRNHLVGQVLNSGMDFDYVLWIDSDSVFSVQQVEELIKHDKDIVSGLYYKRRAKDLEAVAFQDVGDKYISIIPESGLQEVEAVGFGFILMKQKVIEEMFKEYGIRQFEFQYFDESNEYKSEDITWCERVKKLGYKIWLDADCRIGHYGAMV